MTLPNSDERRRADRFPIHRELKYKVLNKKYTHESGLGKTLNISSSGILFSTDQLLLPGRRIEVSINWPANLDNKCSLRLVARGKVVRFERGMAAMEIHQYEFRTAGVATQSAE